jgi:cytoskeletal protein RodZ
MNESVGYYLKRTREVREIELEDIAKKTKISVRFLKAIEEEKWNLLPGEVFIKGFIRTYAQFLGLNPDEVVEKYLQERAKDQRQIVEVEKKEKSKINFLWIPLGIVFLMILSSVIFLSFKNIKKEKKNFDIKKEQKEIIREEEKLIKEEINKIELLFTRHCWLKVEIDGKKVFEGFKEAGDKLEYNFNETFILKVGDAGALQVIKDGVLQQRLGEDGQPVLFKIP